MNKHVSIVMAVLSIVAATGGVSLGVKAASERNHAEQEARMLREQLAGMIAKESAQIPSADNATNSTPLIALDSTETETNEVAALQAKLAEQSAEMERLRAALEAKQNNQNEPRESFQDRMARMKEEDPERYTEMVQRRTERQEQMRYDQASRLAAFMGMDTSTMSAEELANHNLLVDKLSGIWEQTADFNPEQPPDRESMRSMFESMREIGDLMDQERTVIFKQLGNEVGLNGSEAEDFAAYVESIIDTTTLRMPRGGPRGGR